MICCDMCGTTAKCSQREIEGKEFDICENCWRPFEDLLSGKGRPMQAIEALEEYEEMVY